MTETDCIVPQAIVSVLANIACKHLANTMMASTSQLGKVQMLDGIGNVCV